jgi:hypothetical protein
MMNRTDISDQRMSYNCYKSGKNEFVVGCVALDALEDTRHVFVHRDGRYNFSSRLRVEEEARPTKRLHWLAVQFHN